jgi:hypothetical protein
MLDGSSQKRTTAIALPLAAVLAATVLAACGASTKSASTPPAASVSRAAPSHVSTTSARAAPGNAAFIARADTVCRRLNSELDATQAHRGESNGAIATNALEHATLEQRTTAELGSLSPPAALAHDWKQIVAYRRVLASDLVTLAHMLKAGENPKTSGLLSAKSAAHATMTTIAKHDGFIDCTAVGSAS